MLTQFISSLPSSSIVTVKETITSFKLTYVHGIYNDIPIQKVCALLAEISSRDDFELLIEAGEALFSSTHVVQDITMLANFCEDAIDIGEISVTLTVIKKVLNNTLSVYSVAAFESYFATEEITPILDTLAKFLSNTLHFEFLGTTDYFATRTISFGLQQNNATAFLGNRTSIVEKFKESSSFSGISSSNFIPDDFYLATNAVVLPITKFLNHLCGMLSMMFLANISELDSNNNYSFRIYGYKAIDCRDVDPVYLIQNYQMLYKIYRWVYDTDNITDRLGLARNVISLHLDSNGFPILDTATWEAIQSNYKIYLRGNIESYLEAKGKISDILIDATGKTNQLSENLLDSLKTNAFAIITFLITVVVINGVKDMNASTVFSPAYLIIVGFVTAMSGIWLHLMKKDVDERFDATSTIVSSIVSRNYSSILSPSEITQSVDPAMQENKNQLQNQIRKYSNWWKVMLISFFIFYFLGFVGHVILTKEQTNDSEIKAKASQKDKSSATSGNSASHDNKISAKNTERNYIGPRS